MITGESGIDSALKPTCFCTYVRFTAFSNIFIKLFLPTFSIKNNTTKENN